MSELPPTSVEMHALGHLARVLSWRDPALLEEWVDSLQDEALLNEIIQFRGPRESAHVKAVRAGALAWAKHVRLLTLAVKSPKPRIKPPASRRAVRPPGSGSSP